MQQQQKKAFVITDAIGDAIEPLNCNLVASKEMCVVQKKICVWYMTCWYLCVSRHVITNPLHDTLAIFALTLGNTEC